MAITQIDGGKQIRAATVTDAAISASAAIALTKLAEPVLQADGGQAWTGDQNAASHKITSITDASTDTDVPSWGQVKALNTGRDWKDEVDIATAAAGTLASSFENGDTVDGVPLVTGWRILIKDQAAPAENGIYVVNASGAPTRAVDADSTAEVSAGMSVPVVRGTANGGTVWMLTTTGAITLGSTSLTFVQTGETITVDASITKTGHQLSRAALAGDVTAGAGSNATTVANGAITLAKQANLAANSVEGNLTGSAATPAAVSAVATATASSVMTRDANANTRVNAVATGVATTATAAGTTTLTAASAQVQQFTGATTQICVLPDATTVPLGQTYVIANDSTGAVQVNANGGGGVRSVPANTTAIIILIAAGSAAGTWTAGTTAAATGLSTSNFVTRETPSGTLNSSNPTFTLANTPTPGTEEVFFNGALLEPGAGNDYTISGATLTMLTVYIPAPTDKIRVNYRK